MYNWRIKSVHNVLEKKGKAAGPLSIEDLIGLGHLDQYHYLGTQACDEVAEILGLAPGSKLLDVGSGIGGPARYLAATTGCNVVGVELQADLCEAAADLTSRVHDLSKRVQFIQGNGADLRSMRMPAPYEPFGENFDHFVSLLVNLHVPNRPALLEGLFARLKTDGTFVIEDFAALRPPTAAEAATLVDLVKAPSVTSLATYLDELKQVGFVDMEAKDMTPLWADWTAARSREYVATEAEAVALHGRSTFESRAHFYAAIAELFAGGRVGGVRITGRKPGRREAHLHAARAKLAKRPLDAPAAVRILENGAQFAQAPRAASERSQGEASEPPLAAAAALGCAAHGVTATQASAAQILHGASAAQPPLPWLAEPRPGLHDSLQYHFFLGPLFVALRVFHTNSLQSTTAWAYDFTEPGSGPLELVNTYVPHYSPAGRGAAAALRLENGEVAIADSGADGVVITLRPSSKAAAALLARAGVPAGASGAPELVIEAAQGHVYGWMPAGFESDADRPVVHRPQMTARVARWRGAPLQGYGYSKRYHGIYPRHNSWRFIHGIASANGGVSPLAPSPPHILWTADATFGDDKYNYFKLLPAEAHVSGALRESACEDTYQQQDVAFGVLGGERAEARIREIARWHTILGGRGDGSMEMKMENRLCELSLQVGEGEAPVTGYAYNERCFGTLW